MRGCRTLGKKDLVLNAALPKIEVDPDSYEVRADGELLRCEPADVLPLAQRYFFLSAESHRGSCSSIDRVQQKTLVFEPVFKTIPVADDLS